MEKKLSQAKKDATQRYHDKFYIPAIYLPAELKDEIKQLADEEYLSVSKYLSRIIIKAVKDARK